MKPKLRQEILWKGYLMCGRLPCLSQKLRIKLEHTLTVVMATAVLHNIAKEQNDSVFIDSSPEEVKFKES